jgi:hypothetical protein
MRIHSLRDGLEDEEAAGVGVHHPQRVVSKRDFPMTLPAGVGGALLLEPEERELVGVERDSQTCVVHLIVLNIERRLPRIQASAPVRIDRPSAIVSRAVQTAHLERPQLRRVH